jgi:catechol 2,3-dioxygenase-like lactoylglutathione lyase family enzyme
MANELRLALDHVTLSVADLAGAKTFYQAALKPVGLEVVGEVTAEVSGTVGLVGFGIGPGVREAYHPMYYAAFITDPEGHNIEVVCFEPEQVS